MYDYMFIDYNSILNVYGQNASTQMQFRTKVVHEKSCRRSTRPARGMFDRVFQEQKLMWKSSYKKQEKLEC